MGWQWLSATLSLGRETLRGVFLRTPGGLTETSPEVFGKDPVE